MRRPHIVNKVTTPFRDFVSKDKIHYTNAIIYNNYSEDKTVLISFKR